MIATYAPHSIDTDPVYLPYGPLVGGQSALTARDADTAYAEMESSSNLGRTDTAHTYRLALEAGSPAPPAGVTPSGLVFEAEYKCLDEPVFFYVSGVFPTAGERTVAGFTQRPTTYRSFSVDATPNISEALRAEMFDPAMYWTFFPGKPGFGLLATIRVTYLRAHVTFPGDPAPTVERPLRQRQRDDGLALSTLRQKARTSRQGTIRQKSYL